MRQPTSSGNDTNGGEHVQRPFHIATILPKIRHAAVQKARTSFLPDGEGGISVWTIKLTSSRTPRLLGPSVRTRPVAVRR
jgi:hypothetical protein